ncbi:alanine/ornithine racemase family PLP-dependent enzyme [Methylomarinum vadi]|uniref:alanine/ornithine racemase family PLP-dependent enzyme n=1 Tax=Methylomarinum vadi TaxID=438855 RepID=UPI000564B147|nr:alanine/ornithine racemase family PLP-dependent enzyme [Methylomarinum vadi]
MAYPLLDIDLDKIEHNARVIVELCSAHGIRVSGVTKVVCGHPAVAAAMLRGGVAGLADSRIENIRRMRAAGIDTTFMLLRLPALSRVDEVSDCVDISLNSELETLQALSASALRRGKVHDMILMIDLGDLREGVWPDHAVERAKALVPLPGIRLQGIGTNLACFGGLMPTHANMLSLVELAGEIERACEIDLTWISGINSSGLNLLVEEGMPERVNHARIGEAILLGRETTERSPWPNTYQDAFILQAEVIELKRKPSAFAGEHCEDAFGGHPHFVDHGNILHALVNVGRQDVAVEGITPQEALTVIGASSDYLGLDVSALAGRIEIGDILSFNLNYAALLAAMTSAYVEKRCVRGRLFDDRVLYA